MDPRQFERDENGSPVLENDHVSIIEESKIYRRNPSAGGAFVPFAWNPWPQLKTANAEGNFSYQDEARFPLFKQERDADGKVIVRDGLQVWSPVDLHLGDTTVFQTVNAVKEAAEDWSGRTWSGDRLAFSRLSRTLSSISTHSTARQQECSSSASLLTAS
jgi:hypothetical protein